MAKRHFLMLAHTYTAGLPIGGWFASEKLDGMRAFWDGGISRGRWCDEVPFANVEKDSRYLIRQRATGLWSRYGKAIQAPNSWLDLLPPYLLDGELYMGHGSFQTLISTTKDLTPGPLWSQVKFLVFDSPPPHIVFADGEISETNFKKKFVHLLPKLGAVPSLLPGAPQFRHVYDALRSRFPENEVFQVHRQAELLPYTKDATGQLESLLDTVVSTGGEGFILRHPTSTWIPARVKTLLKVKPQLDAEATVIGYTAGRETDLGSKLLGLMGALVVVYNGRVFELSGFTDLERELSHPEVVREMSGQRLPDFVTSSMFPRGSRVSFKYRELTDQGVPKEARYWRKSNQ